MSRSVNVLFWSIIFCMVLRSSESFETLSVDFSPEYLSEFVSEGGCDSNYFRDDKYENYPDITPPYGASEYFLKMTNVGCLLTKSLLFNPISTLIVVYKTISPGLELDIIIANKTYRPNMNVTSWGTFAERIENISTVAQVRVIAKLSGGEPFFILDRIQISSEGLKPNIFKSVQTSSTTKSERNLKIKTAKTKKVPPLLKMPIARMKTRVYPLVRGWGPLHDVTFNVHNSEELKNLYADKYLKARYYNREDYGDFRDTALKSTVAGENSSETIRTIPPKASIMIFWRNVAIASLLISIVLLGCVFGISGYMNNSCCS